MRSGRRHARSWGNGLGEATWHLAMGIFLTILGAVLTLDRLQLVDASRLLQWWPLGLHVLGATILARRQDPNGRFWGVTWLILGTWLLLNTLGLIRISLGDLLWPLLLVFVGVRLIMKARHGSASDSTNPVSWGGSPNLVAVMSEARGSVEQDLVRGSLTAILGGCALDLSRATIPPGAERIVDVFAMMGGHEIVVPPGWTVNPNVVSVLAGVEDKRLPNAAGPSLPGSAPTLTVRGAVVFGGLTIKN